ncbi:MAG: DinB family protein [Ilumatobacter sp.]|uniref:DinB family protein n=1 Tax=Ilumatobacter sp. TaxID=1967498 RepID=UPI0026361E0B|nr:DinB family protein [Ilumatobacter sp.]MDJ0767560.1 DinB family protein [Ilumatobacter sp.]
MPDLTDLLAEYDRALGHTEALWSDLTPEEVRWRPHPESSAIGWHLGHQAAVAHFMVRNLTAAEPSPDPPLDGLFDSATPEPERGELPEVERLGRYRKAVAERVRFRIGAIERGDVGAPAQLSVVAALLVTALVNHEYQHSVWIGEVRRDQLGHDLPAPPASPLLTTIDGYTVLRPPLG